MQAEKELIAGAAASLVPSGTAIAISAGTTTYALAKRLTDIPGLTVLTNSVPVAEVLYKDGRPDQTVILSGGVRTPSDALVGPFAVAVIRSLHVDSVFMGSHGMDLRSGFTTPNILEAETNRALIEAGRRLVVLADSTKWGTIGISSVARLEEADTIVTDSGLDATARQQLSAAVRRLILVDVATSGVQTIEGEDGSAVGPGELGGNGVSKGSTASQLPSQPHRRYNALSDEWLLVSAERTSRPWLGRQETPPPQDLPAYDPSCYLCPGNVRANGERNPEYDSTFVFTNDFAALQPDTPLVTIEDGLLRAKSERGTCKVICFSPRHDLSLSRMNATQARTVVDLWATQTASLGEQFPWVQVFENRGAPMGASNPTRTVRSGRRHPAARGGEGGRDPVPPFRRDRSQAPARLCRTGGGRRQGPGKR